MGTSTTNHSTTSAANSTPEPIQNTTCHKSHSPGEVKAWTTSFEGGARACH
jgi:hypothetical protein